MEIVSLQIQNFGPIEDAYINLSGQGLVNIEGDNRDDPSANSNGSGKSTIPDALYWVLFGQTARGVKGDDVIANFAGKDCYGAVILKDGDDTYLVERWRKKAKFKGKPSGLALSRTTAEGELIDLTGGTDALTQAKIESVLGCSEEVFTKAVYSGQEALPDLPNMTDKQIKELVEEAAGIEILSAAYTLARDNFRRVEAQQSERLRNLNEAERRLNDSTVAMNDLIERREGWAGDHSARVEVAEAKLKHAVDEAKVIAVEIRATDTVALQSTLDRLRASVTGVEAEKVEERRLSGEAATAARTAAISKAGFDSLMNDVRRAKAAFDAVEAKVGSPCDECGKPHTAEDVADVKRIAGDKLKLATDEARKMKASMEADAEVARVAQEAALSYRSGMTDVSEVMASISNLEATMREHSQLNANLDRKKDEVVRLRGDVDKVKVETNPYSDLVATAGAKVDDAGQAVVEAVAAVTEGEAAVAVAQAAVKVFGPAGVRAYVLDTVTPYLNERTAHYLGTLSDGRIEAVWTTLAKNSKGELMERFAIEVEKTGGGKSFKALSGGEKRKVRLACALALQDLVSSRATKPISLWIGDEIDDALDEAGLERLMSVLEEKAREKGTVLVISHNSLRDWIRETVTVTMEGGKSTVAGAIC